MLQSRAAQAADRYAIDVLERVDGMAALRNGLRRVAADRKEWAGIPMPLSGSRLIIEPTYPMADKLAAIGAPPEEPDDPAKIRNTFWSWHRRSNIVVWEEPDGRILGAPSHGTSQVDLMLETLSVSDAWGIEQERNAIDTLGTMLPHRQFKQYLLTGMFMEQSKRSGVHYIFRRLRPTVAIRHHKDGRMRVLCCLCMHPIGYYAGSWAGAMCPTDDVVAHLALMRGDEHMFWRRCNQHPPWVREAGL